MLLTEKGKHLAKIWDTGKGTLAITPKTGCLQMKLMHQLLLMEAVPARPSGNKHLRKAHTSSKVLLFARTSNSFSFVIIPLGTELWCVDIFVSLRKRAQAWNAGDEIQGPQIAGGLYQEKLERFSPLNFQMGLGSCE